MSQPVLNSQANSAMVNTLLNTESLRIPAEYSTKIIDYPHAVQYTRIDPPSQDFSANGQTTINLLKYGIATQILLSYDKEITPTNANPAIAKVDAGDIFRVINRVELMSSSRIISTITSEGLQAQISAMSQSQLIPVYRNALRSRDYSSTQTGTIDPAPKFTYVLPLRFGLLSQEGVMNLSFLETCSVRITLGKLDYVPTGGGTFDKISNLHLKVRFQTYPEEAMAQILASNFSENDLNVLSSRLYKENGKEHQAVLNSDSNVAPYSRLQKVVVDIKNVDCVSKFYIMVRRKGTASASTTPLANTAGGTGVNLSNPLPIKSIRLTASGQEIIKLDQNELEYAVLEENGLANGNAGAVAGVAGTGCGIENIVCLPMGLYTNDMVVSNVISLREMNNTQIEVEFYIQGADSNSTSNFQVDVVEDTVSIYSIASSTGRIGLSLAN